MAESPASEVRLAAQIRAHQSWAKTVDRSARTAPARAALERQFLEKAGGDPSARNTSARPTTSGWRSSPPPVDGATVSAARPLPVTTLPPDGVALRGFDYSFLGLCGPNLIIATTTRRTTPSRPPR
jgi:hypothetical protein